MNESFQRAMQGFPAKLPAGLSSGDFQRGFPAGLSSWAGFPGVLGAPSCIWLIIINFFGALLGMCGLC